MTIAGGHTRAVGLFIDGVSDGHTGIGATIIELRTPVYAIQEVHVEANAATNAATTAIVADSISVVNIAVHVID